MRIVNNDYNIVSFKNIDIGGNFRYLGCYYIRIKEVRDYTVNECIYNAVGLTTGCLVFFCKECKVEHIELEARVWNDQEEQT